MKKNNLDKEERDILDAIEKGEWKAVKPRKAELSHYAEFEKNTFRKDQRMNSRISKADLTRIKLKMAEEGVPYQTLVAGILHKYVSGTFRAA